MKKLLLVCWLLVIGHWSMGQIPQFLLTPNGYEPIVVGVPGMGADDMYVKALEWVNLAYENADEVVRGKIEGQIVRIGGFVPAGITSVTIGRKFQWDYSYEFSIEFKEGRYRVSISDLVYFEDALSQKIGTSYFWKKNGLLRGDYRDCPSQMDANFNQLNQSLFDYLTGSKSSDDNWH